MPRRRGSRTTGHTLDPGQKATRTRKVRLFRNLIGARHRSRGMTLDPGQRARYAGPKSIKPKLSIQVPKLRKK